jgi:hypothetical protein
MSPIEFPTSKGKQPENRSVSPTPDFTRLDRISRHDKASPTETHKSDTARFLYKKEIKEDQQAPNDPLEEGRRVMEKAETEDISKYTDTAFDHFYITEANKINGSNGRYEVVTYSKFYPGERYTNEIDLNKQEIVMKRNDKDNKKIFPNSEIVYRQYLAVLKKEGKNLSDTPVLSIRGENTVNPQTMDTVGPLFPKSEAAMVSSTEKKTFSKGMPEFLKLIGTPACKGKWFLSKQRPQLFGGRELHSITVEKSPSRNAIDSFTYHFK